MESAGVSLTLRIDFGAISDQVGGNLADLRNWEPATLVLSNNKLVILSLTRLSDLGAKYSVESVWCCHEETVDADNLGEFSQHPYVDLSKADYMLEGSRGSKSHREVRPVRDFIRSVPRYAHMKNNDYSAGYADPEVYDLCSAQCCCLHCSKKVQPIVHFEEDSIRRYLRHA